VMTFNMNNIAEFMATVELTYFKYNINHPWQVMNLGETGCSPGRDQTRKTAHRVVTLVGKQVPWSKVNFKYSHRISFLACVNAAGEWFLSAPIFKGIREPRLSRGCHTIKVSKLMPKGWMAFWRKDVASVDSGIFIRWAREFIKQIRAKYGLQDWIVLFYDACRAHMTYEVINLFYTNKIAVIALPAHSR